MVVSFWTCNCEAVSCRLYYLAWEFSYIIVQVVYIPPSANGKLVTEAISRVTQDLLRSSPDVVIIKGEFNLCSLSATLHLFKQVVSYPTRSDKTIDLFYGTLRTCQDSSLSVIFCICIIRSYS